MNALARLFHYDYWANSRTIDQVRKLELQDEQILHWINHLLNAEEIWLSRLQGDKSTISLHSQRPLANLSSRCQELHEAFQSHISTHPGDAIEELVEYRDTRGTSFATSHQDILTHIANHSTHHRGQVIARIRELGYAPVKTDYIHYVRHTKLSPA